MDTELPASPGPRIPPPVVAGTAALLQLLLARGASGTRSSRIAGGVLAGASASLMAASVLEFRTADTTLDPHRPQAASSLVTGGVFGWSRNPIYLGMAGLLTAHALGRRSWLAAVPVGLFWLAIDRVQIPAEERALTDRFGTAFEDYVGRVPRWLGLPRPDRR